jgi:hypothetical protein
MKGTEVDSPSITLYDEVTTRMFLCKPRKEKDLIEKMEHDGCERN